MKLKILLLLAIPTFLSLAGTSLPPNPTGIVSIHASKYNSDSDCRIPQKTDSFNIQLYKMRHSYLQDDLISSKEFHSVVDGSYFFAPDTGRYIIVVSQDTLSDALEFNYRGGNISLTLILE